MSPGGILLAHDYLVADGLRTAIDQFFADKPEPIIELAGMGWTTLRRLQWAELDVVAGDRPDTEEIRIGAMQCEC